jgi:2-polyprenyl-3-methyl-5-hydroxy-6-metoxy-1,4-benzoquinol methylase
MAGLDARRRAAALASGGRSDDTIHGLIADLVEQLGATGDVLDFGAGNGELTRRLAACGRFRSVTAIDLVRHAEFVDDHIPFIVSDLNEPTGLPAGSFDLVVSCEVVEHLENPRAVAREWFRLLRPRGSLVMSTPNNESWRSLATLLLRGHFVAFLDSNYPAHLTALLRKDIGRILVEAGFQQPEFYFTDSGGIPRLPSVKWQRLSLGLLRGLRFSDNLVAVTHRA